MQIIVNDLVVAYEKSGQGPVVVLLHGWADTLHSFDTLTSELETHYTVVRLDLAGFGGSQPPRRSWELLDYANYVRDALQKIAIMPNDITILIGHSNGGAIAIKAVGRQILKPQKLVLIASAGIRQDSLKKTVIKLAAKTGKVVTIVLPKKHRQNLRNKFYSKIGSDFLYAEHMQGTFKKIVAEDIRHDAEKVSVPTCLIYGELDTATPPMYGQTLQQIIPSSILHVVQGADHFVHQTEPNIVYERIRDFDKS